MYINMTPDKTNKTLHASQDDTTRQFKFKLVNDSQVLDTSGAATPIKFDVEPDGLEQLLPVNSSSPSTTPIIADIQYPDELREDQEFFERVTPSTIAGKATIKKIKGNALVFNQIVTNPNMTSNTGWYTPDSSITTQPTANNNVLETTFLSTSEGGFQARYLPRAKHKYFVSGYVQVPRSCQSTIVVFQGAYKSTETISANIWVKRTYIADLTNSTSTDTTGYLGFFFAGLEVNDVVKLKDVIFVDLTLMFGAGNEPSTPQEFASLFPLPYYDYNAGSLLSFNGTDIKTTGKNLCNPINANPSIFTVNDGVFTQINPSSAPFDWKYNNSLIKQLLPSGTYTLKVFADTISTNDSSRMRILSEYDELLGDVVMKNQQSASITFTLNRTENIGICCKIYNGAWKFQISVGSSVDNYEVYKEITSPLTTLNYFPTGMKSAGTVYDELTPYQVITRVGAVDMGTLTYIRELFSGSQYRFKTQSINDKVKLSSVRNPNLLCPLFIGKTDNSNGSMFIGGDGVFFYNNSYTSASDFKTAMSGVYLFYELATPTEQNFESYSLVSEDIEIPLEYDSGFLVCDSNGLTSKAGFMPCKIKMAKEDETLYSQLINLHIERKP